MQMIYSELMYTLGAIDWNIFFCASLIPSLRAHSHVEVKVQFPCKLDQESSCSLYFLWNSTQMVGQSKSYNYTVTDRQRDSELHLKLATNRFA